MANAEYRVNGNAVAEIAESLRAFMKQETDGHRAKGYTTGDQLAGVLMFSYIMLDTAGRIAGTEPVQSIRIRRAVREFVNALGLEIRVEGT